MAKSNIPAKDLAFAKEQLRFRQTVRDLNQEINREKAIISDQKDEIMELQDTIRSQQEWIERLLDYTNLTPAEQQEFKAQMKSAKAVNDAIDLTSSLFGAFFRY